MDFIKNFWLELNKKENFKSLVIFMCVAMVVGVYLAVKTCTAIAKFVSNSYQQYQFEKCLDWAKGHKLLRQECLRRYSSKSFSVYTSYPVRGTSE